MAMQAENMSYDHLKEIVDGLSYRAIPPLVMPEVPPGSFDLASFPMTELEQDGNPGVHFFDVIAGHPGDLDYFAISAFYKLACERKDLQLLPEPFGLKDKVPKETTMQMVLLKQADGKITILKRLSFPEKLKPLMLRKLIFGNPLQASIYGSQRLAEKFCNTALKTWEVVCLRALTSHPKLPARQRPNPTSLSKKRMMLKSIKVSSIYFAQLQDLPLRWPS